MYWSIHLEGGPRRVNHAAVGLGGKIYSFGGYCSGENYEIKRPLDVFVLDTSNYHWKELCKPTEDMDQYALAPYQRYGHTVVVYENKAYLWGGSNDSDGQSSILHQFDPVSHEWNIISPIDGMMPPARDGHSACVVGDFMVIFGGYEEQFQRFSPDTYAFNFSTRKWIKLQTHVCPPAPQVQHSHSNW